MAWVRVSAYDEVTIDPIVWNWVNSFRLVLNNGSLEFSLGNNGVWLSVIKESSQLATNQWYHVAVTFDGSEAISFINGVSTSSVQLISKVTPEGNDFYIGGTRDGESFSGDIDEVHLWRKILSAQQISDYYVGFN